MRYLFTIILLIFAQLSFSQPVSPQIPPPSTDQIIDWADRYEDTERRESIIEFIEERLTNTQYPLDERGIEVLGSTLNRLKLIGQPIEVNGFELDGTKLSLEEYKGKVVLVDFWASWCGPCVQEISKIKPIYKKYKGNFEILGVNLDDTRLNAINAKIRLNIPWKNLAKTKEVDQIITKYNISSIPRGVLIDKQGNVVKLDVHSTELESEIKKLLEK